MRARWTERAWLALFLAVIAGYCAFIISAGHFTFWPDQGWDQPDFYDTQAEGFRAGHLYTTRRPHPKLLRVPNPYDYRYRRFWTWDYSLYQGHLYLYWGLTPAALLALVKSLFRIEAPVRDAALVFAFLLGRALAGALLLRQLARRFQPRPPAWSVWVALLVFAAAHPVPFLLARPAVYEAALSGGACFLTAALHFGLSWLFSAAPEQTGRRLAASSLCLGLAGTCRPSLLPAGAALVVMLSVFGLTRSPALRRPLSALRLGAAAALPFTALVLAHFVVNHARFGSWAEFGVHYQLGIPFDMGLRYVPANLWNYSLHSLHRSCQFPFLIPRWHGGFPISHHLPSWLPPPNGYYVNEPLAGVLKAVPFTWLICAPLLGYAARRRQSKAAAGSPTTDRRWRWVWGLLAVATLAASAPILLMFASSMRYEAEFLSPALVLSTLGGWALLSLLQGRSGAWFAKSSYGALALASVLMATAYGWTGYYNLFATQHPQLFHSLQEKWSFCR